MRWAGYNAYYYKAFPMEALTLCLRPTINGTTTGGMGVKQFLALKESIQKEGLINPIVIESSKTFRIALGHNRVEAMKQFGHTHIKAVVINKGARSLLPGYEGIPNQCFEAFMKRTHPGDKLWVSSQWAKRVIRSAIQVEELSIVNV